MKAVLAGFGHQGKSYAEKFSRHADEWGVTLAGIVDPSPSALASAPAVAHHTDIDQALSAIKPDIVINTANNEAHIDIIRALERHPSVRGYLTEKPLVGEAENEAEATARLNGYFVSMNMVTNFSEAAGALREWHQENPQWKLVGIDSVWGKDRRADTRPTTGIANDIVHPVGLVQSIFSPADWTLHDKAQGLYGELSRDRDGNDLRCVFHYRAKFQTDIAPVLIDASYAWKDQQRSVTAFFHSGGADYIAAELFLDAPEEDSKRRSDFLRLSTLDKDFVPRVLDEGARSSQDKLESFLRNSFEAFRSGTPSSEAGLVGLPEEKAIGEVYALLHPGQDWNTLSADENLNIWEADANEPSVPRVPVTQPLADTDPSAIRARISRFGAMFRFEPPVASFTERLEYR